MKSAKKLDNKGFTLIELIIAVMLLAIVIVPLLHSFVSSHRINGKSKQYMRATTLAQDEMEKFEKAAIADLIDPDNTACDYVNEDGDPVEADSNGRYVFVRENVDNNSGSNVSKFDVVVTLDPERSTDTSRYYDANTKQLFYMNSIASSDSAVYVQAIRSATNLKGYDDTIYEYFEANKDNVGVGSSWVTKDFEENLARRIKVKIYQENNGLNIATIVKVTYEYVLCQTGIMPPAYQSYTEESIIFNNSAQSVGEDGKLPELKSVYLFYAPRYRGYSPSHSIDYPLNGETNTYKTDEDWIVIDNEAELPIDIYVVRQDIFKRDLDPEDMTKEKYDPVKKESVPMDYQPKIEIHDGIETDENGKAHTIANYFTNLNIDQDPVLSNGVVLGKQIDFSSHMDNSDPGRPYSTAEARPIIDPKDLNGVGSSQAQEKDRIYTMKVEVYNHGADRTTEKPLVTMTGSKIE